VIGLNRKVPVSIRDGAHKVPQQTTDTPGTRDEVNQLIETASLIRSRLDLLGAIEHSNF
jgi:hypothetical protein